MTWATLHTGSQALGGSMMNPVAVSIIVNTFTDRAERARAIGVWGAAIGVSLALGPVVGGVLIGEKADVLSERPAEGHVQELDAAAHTENRQISLECANGELKLVDVLASVEASTGASSPRSARAWSAGEFSV